MLGMPGMHGKPGNGMSGLHGIPGMLGIPGMHGKPGKPGMLGRGGSPGMSGKPGIKDSNFAPSWSLTSAAKILTKITQNWKAKWRYNKLKRVLNSYSIV